MMHFIFRVYRYFRQPKIKIWQRYFDASIKSDNSNQLLQKISSRRDIFLNMIIRDSWHRKTNPLMVQFKNSAVALKKYLKNT